MFRSLILKEMALDLICLLVGKASGFRTIRPVVIVGTGRCGTNLLGDVLSSHPDIIGFPSEANELWHPKLEPFETTTLDKVPPIEVDPARFSEISIANWPPNHGERIRDTFTGFHLVAGRSKVFFVRSAMISFLIPEILGIFPDAKFIHPYRFGPSVVESYFKKNFGKYSRFTFSASDYRLYCARYWNACILEIEKRKKELSLETKGQFLEFSYESLCRNPKEVSGALSGYLCVDSDGFRFDLATISSQNYKAPDYARDPEGTKLLDAMEQGMRLKGYSSERRT